MLPHHVNDRSADEGIFNNEWVEIRRRVRDDSAHNWVSATDGSVINIGDQGSWVEAVERLENLGRVGH